MQFIVIVKVKVLSYAKNNTYFLFGNKCWIGLLDLNDQIYPWEAGAWVGDKEHRRTNPELNVRAASDYSGVRKQGV